MEQEAVSVKLRNSLQSSKEFVSKRYQNFADYMNKTYTERREKGRNKTLKMALAKYVLVFLNIFYMLTSLVMIDIGAIGQIVHIKFDLWPELKLLSIYWIATGVILLTASIFGIIGAFKESVIWTNIFGVLMTIVFVIQITTAIVTFQFIGRSQSFANNVFSNLMDRSWDSIAQARMDLIQISFQCCGNNGPSDWNDNEKFRRPFLLPYNYYYQTTTTTTLSTPLRDRMPLSCCIAGSAYNDLSCDKYYQSGCKIQLREVFSETIMIVGSVALAIAAFEILGIVFAFLVARIMRKTKSFIAIQQYDELSNHPNNREATSAKAVENVSENVETI